MLPIDDDTPRQLYTDNPTEWFLTSTEARIPVTALQSPHPLRAFTPTQCDTPIIPMDTEWARRDLVLERVHRRNEQLFYRFHTVVLSTPSKLNVLTFSPRDRRQFASTNLADANNHVCSGVSTTRWETPYYTATSARRGTTGSASWC